MSSTIRTPCPSRSAPHHWSASQIDGSPNPSPAWIVKWKFSWAIRLNASRCRVGGYPASGPAMSNPTTPSSRWRTATSAISTERAACRIAVTIRPIVIGRPSDPRRNPSSIAVTASSSVRPAIGQELGGHSDLGVDDPVRRQVLGALGAHALDRVARLHDRRRVAEPIEVQLERLAVGARREPPCQLVGIGRRQVAIADLRREVEHRLGPQAAVEMVVQEHLRRTCDQAMVHAPMLRPDVPHVRLALLVAGPIRQLGGAEPVSLVETPRSIIDLECPEFEAGRAACLREAHESRTDAAAGPTR